MILLIHSACRLLFLYYLCAAVSYTLLMIIALAARPKHRFRLSSINLESLKRSPFLAPVSIILPAKNEAATILESVRALLDLDYPEIELIVVNDGSTDLTLELMRDAYQLREAGILYVSGIRTAPVRSCYLSRTEPRLVLVDKESGGTKADAVNAGLNAATGAFVCIIDADSILEKDALLRLMAAVHIESTAVVAAGGIVRVVNGSEVRNGVVERVQLPARPLEVFQVVEYLRAFLIGRDGWAKLDMLPIISGAFGLFRTAALREIGGLDRTTVGEDFDLVIRLHRKMREKGQKYRIAFVPDPTCWTEVPSDVRSLGRQRARWQQGMLQVLWRNRDMLFRPQYGCIGSVLLPYLWLFEVMEPIIEAVGYVAIVFSLVFRIYDTALLLQILLLGFGFSVLVSLGSVLLEEMTYRRYQSWRDVARLVQYCFLEYVPYHQMHLWWRIRGLLLSAAGRQAWHGMKRTGFHTSPSAVSDIGGPDAVSHQTSERH